MSRPMPGPDGDGSYVPRLKDARSYYAWAITGGVRGVGERNLRARRSFDRLIDQIRADAYARGRASAPDSHRKRLTYEGCYAHYWQAAESEADAAGRSWFYDDPATVNAARMRASRARVEAATWHRFATHPHALEEA